MVQKNKYPLPKKLEIISISEKIGLRQTEKIYGTAKKTIIKWKIKYQEELKNYSSQINGSEKYSSKILQNSLADSNCWIINIDKIQSSVSERSLYLLTATQSHTGITLPCITDENISIYSNFFIEYLLVFLQKAGESNGVQIIIQHGRFKIGRNKFPVDPRLKELFPHVIFRKDISSKELPEKSKLLSDTIFHEHDSSELISRLYNKTLKANIIKICDNSFTNKLTMLFYQPKFISMNFRVVETVNKINLSNLQQIKGRLFEEVNLELDKFNFYNAETILNFLSKTFTGLEHKIRILLLIGCLYVKKYDYEKAGKSFLKAMNLVKNSDDVNLKIEAGIALADYFIKTSKYKRSEKLLIDILKLSQTNKLKSFEGNIVGKIGVIYKFTNNPQSKAMFNKQVEIAIEIDDKTLYCDAMNNLSNYYITSGEYQNASLSAKKSLSVATKNNNLYAINRACINLAQYALDNNDYKMAEKYLTINLNAISLYDIPPLYAIHTAYWGYTKCRQGDFKTGLAHLEKGLALTKQIGDLYNESLVSTLIGLAYYSTIDSQKAIFYFNKAVKLNIKMSNQEQQIVVYGFLVNCYNRLKQFPRALEFAIKQYEIIKLTGNQVLLASAHENIGFCAFCTNEFELAIENLQLQLKILKNTTSDLFKALCLCNIGLIFLKTNDYLNAKTYFIKAVKILEPLDNYRFLIRVYLDLANIVKATGNVKKLNEYINIVKEKAGIVGDFEIIEMADELLKS